MIDYRPYYKSFLNKMFDEKLDSIKFKDRPLRKIKEVTPSRRHVQKMTEEMLAYQDFIALVATIIKKEIKKAVVIGSEREN